MKIKEKSQTERLDLFTRKLEEMKRAIKEWKLKHEQKKENYTKLQT